MSFAQEDSVTERDVHLTIEETQNDPCDEHVHLKVTQAVKLVEKFQSEKNSME